MHHHDAGTLASDRTAAGSGGADDRFLVGLQYLARRLLFSTPGLAPAERQFLYDLARNEARIPMTGLRRIMTIAARSQRAEDRELLAELVRAECLVGTHAVEVAIAFDEETAAEGIANPAQRAYERHPSPASRTRVIEALLAHLRGIRCSLDAVMATARRH